MRISDWNEVEQEEGELQQYRSRTLSMLLKYFRMSVELGHLPSLFGREFFRSNVSSYATHSFEDSAIFVLDMERVLARLPQESQSIMGYVVFQQYSYDELAPLLGIPRRTLVRWLTVALDSCSRILLDGGLMERVRVPLSAKTVQLLSRRDELPPKKPSASVGGQIQLGQKFCQEGKNYKINVSV